MSRRRSRFGDAPTSSSGRPDTARPKSRFGKRSHDNQSNSRKSFRERSRSKDKDRSDDRFRAEPKQMERERVPSPKRKKDEAPDDWAAMLSRGNNRNKRDKRSSKSSDDDQNRSPSPAVQNNGGRTPPGANSGGRKLWIDELTRGSRETIQMNFAIRTQFGKYGIVENVDLKVNTKSRMKGTACVEMSTAAEAVEACRNLNGKMILGQGPMKVSICDPNRKYSKGGRGGRRGGGFRGGRGGRRGGGFRGGRGGGYRGGGRGGSRNNYSSGRSSGGYGGGRSSNRGSGGGSSYGGGNRQGGSYNNRRY